MKNTIDYTPVSDTANHNYGIDILRCILALTIVFGHFWTDRNNSAFGNELIKLQNIAAPSFFLLSFFLSAKYIVLSNNGKHHNRIKRLLLLFYFWGFIGWAVQALFSGAEKDSVIMSLIWQLFTGSSANTPLWYLIVLVWITMLYFFIFKIAGRKAGMLIVSGLGVLSLAAQYTGINYWLFGNLPFEVKYTFGRILEMMPYASVGMLLWHVLNKIPTHSRIQTRVIPLVCSMIGLVVYYRFCYSLQPEGFYYAGLPRLIGGTSLVMFFVSLPIPTASKPVTTLIRNITNYTPGIYCMHIILGFVIQKAFLIDNQVLLCFMIYMAGYIISLLISRIKRFECLVK